MKNKLFEIMDPIPKQSVRFGVTRYRTSGTHQDAFTGSTVNHRKGDVVVYKNSKTGLRDVILVAYPKPEVVAWEKYIANSVKYQLPLNFKMWEKAVVIQELYFIFNPLKSFSKKKMEIINTGGLIMKNTKSDLDNLMKPLWDSIEGLVFKNDSLIESFNGVHKCYGKPGIKLIIKGE